MTTKGKAKGNAFEKNAAALLTEKIKGSDFRRIPGSGAIGTTMNEPLLTGDLRGTVTNFPKTIKVECKVGYSNKKEGETKSINILKLWVDKIRMEAQNNFSFPLLIAHFDGARQGTKNIVILDVDDFSELVNLYTSLKKELEGIYAATENK